MSDLAIDPLTGDLALEAGKARLVYGAEAVAQAWQTRLTLFKGECVLDRNLGIDYQNDILEKGARQSVMRAIFADVTRRTSGVRDVRDLRFSLNRASRVLTVLAEVSLEDGQDTTLTFSEPLG